MNRSPLVVVTDSPFPDLRPARTVLSQVHAEVKVLGETSHASILSAVKDADAVLVTYAKITAEMIKQMPRCRIISRFGIGVDNVDLEAASAAEIRVTRVPDYCIEEVADHAMALLLAAARKICFANGMVHRGLWSMTATAPIFRLRDKVLGLFGFGRIARAVAERARAFGIRVIAADPAISPDSIREAAAEPVSFDELIERSDFISIHTPLLPETQHCFNSSVFPRMRRTAFLINTARGPIIDEGALAGALDDGLIAGAALDVMIQEPPHASPLFGRDNVLLTPHMSFYSVESLVDLQKRAAEEVVSALRSEPARNPVVNV